MVEQIPFLFFLFFLPYFFFSFFSLPLALRAAQPPYGQAGRRSPSGRTAGGRARQAGTYLRAGCPHGPKAGRLTGRFFLRKKYPLCCPTGRKNTPYGRFSAAFHHKLSIICGKFPHFIQFYLFFVDLMPFIFGRNLSILSKYWQNSLIFGTFFSFFCQI